MLTVSAVTDQAVSGEIEDTAHAKYTVDVDLPADG